MKRQPGAPAPSPPGGTGEPVNGGEQAAARSQRLWRSPHRGRAANGPRSAPKRMVPGPGEAAACRPGSGRAPSQARPPSPSASHWDRAAGPAHRESGMAGHPRAGPAMPAVPEQPAVAQVQRALHRPVPAGRRGNGGREARSRPPEAGPGCPAPDPPSTPTAQRRRGGHHQAAASTSNTTGPRIPLPLPGPPTWVPRREPPRSFRPARPPGEKVSGDPRRAAGGRRAAPQQVQEHQEALLPATRLRRWITILREAAEDPGQRRGSAPAAGRWTGRTRAHWPEVSSSRSPLFRPAGAATAWNQPRHDVPRRCAGPGEGGAITGPPPR